MVEVIETPSAATAGHWMSEQPITGYLHESGLVHLGTN